ncbi:MAG: homoserine kinase [Myxococcales bacterium FL481]|nr:MAG: homoserine kinase [Myxococcales bacterium FL481]
MAPHPWIEAFAPATVSNLGPGFDCLGLALRGPGDTVRARTADVPGVRLLRVSGDAGKLPLASDRNTAAVAVQQLLRHHAPEAGIELELTKGLPLGSGLGSSGASACAAVVAADAALGLNLGATHLIEAAREGERVACGAAHPDNVAPAILGGLVLIPSLHPLRVVALPVPTDLWLAVYTPGHPVATEQARAILPHNYPLPTVVHQAARLGLLVHALHTDDLALLGEAMVDEVAEPARAGLIPGFLAAKAACLEAGAVACTISGAGPSTFAIAPSRERATALLEILEECFTGAGVAGRGHVDTVGPGARVVSAPLH